MCRFIQFLSPASPRCRELAPVWEKLVGGTEHLASRFPAAPLRLGSVDCMAHASLCAREGVTQLPWLKV